MTLDSAVSERQVRSLYHFTTTIGLRYILKHEAILSRSRLQSLCEAEGDASNWFEDILELMDDNRLDRLIDFVNTSISLPNTYLLNAYVGRHEAPYLQWCILEIEASELLREGVLFSVSNAASDSAKRNGIVAGEAGFEALFAPTVRNKYRVFERRQKLPHQPTDIQAEALIPNYVPASKIRGVLFGSESCLNATVASFKQLGQEWGDLRFDVNAGAFSTDLSVLQQALY